MMIKSEETEMTFEMIGKHKEKDLKINQLTPRKVILTLRCNGQVR